MSGVPAGFSRAQMQQNIRGGTFAFNGNAFAEPGQYEFGTAARNYNDVRRDSYKKREFRRVVTNRDLAPNGVTLPTGTFGRATGQGNLPRTIQLVLRVTF